jgi:hypothetical protein
MAMGVPESCVEIGAKAYPGTGPMPPCPSTDADLAESKGLGHPFGQGTLRDQGHWGGSPGTG